MTTPTPAPATGHTPDTPASGAAGTPATLVTATDVGIRIPDGPVLLPPTSLTVRAGEITALTGASGSGKTTLLRALIGHLPARAALACTALDVLGHHVPGLSPAALRALRRSRIAYVGQDPGSALNPRMTIRRLIAETATDAGDHVVPDLLRECRLPTVDGFPDRRPTALSGGQQRRVALARALARTPDILLLDEPTAGLDAALRDDIADLLRHLATARGLAIVMACHDPKLVDTCADHVVRLTAPARPASVAPVSVAPVSAAPAPAPPRVPGRRRPAPAPVVAAGPASAADEGIAARSVSVVFRGRYGVQQALDSVDFTAPPGSATGIVGPSGSGKTTLLRVLAGLHRPDSGTLTLEGQPLAHTARGRRPEHHRRIQFVPQNPLAALNPSRTVGAALTRPLRRHTRLARAEIPGRITALLEQVELPADFARRYPAELSGGQRQRVSIARALAAEPDVLLCDEITSALDPDTAVAVMEVLRRLRTERDMTVALVSHEIHLVAAYTDTVHLLDAGRVTAYGPTAALLPTA
ncbi:ABC transporter ATP-binding protein [Streptomyces avermitilis]|uniref:Peptide ABC transporter ATP-binding protein n=2 Tax=Streptomyces avermitilis TaxID=33903 RepID=Q82BT2_STRAW|nr:ATP-binding cassette domain-containing protein [Streptomyces avermitilis]KUN50442.1 ABC transporter ATP-binding protein [Streptomyces avermitilis]OOV30805.1 ABC transporter ATP-binding protein [Streptomyces avermitilis]BAC73334.1 putative peptide ABC transporter ATP-binding protein [Streptomyces avermitilis MA-4680 = NBRC 14893]BBJ53794.1 ABC transporter ATP-binding protein [Streptomyces avermitilis]GDY83055.1 ABC transporter ATP-binding protein [Streptomyces avermitilis]